MSFSALPGWGEADMRGALSAFVESCRRIEPRADSAPMNPNAPYAGTAGDWREACLEAAMLAGTADARGARAFFERQFTPLRLGDRGRLTGYYEPYVQVREAPDTEFSMAIRGRPGDLLTGDLGQFIAGLEGQRIMGRAADQSFEPYRPRAEIEAMNLGVPLAWGRPIDVFFLQIQGSGRLVYRDGGQARVRFAAHNGLPYVSIGRILIDRGELAPHAASKQDIERWLMRRGPDAWTALFNENPRYVFFSLDVLSDPDEGPLGAQGAPLTPMASMAVDPQYHAWGVPVFVEAALPGAPHWSGLVIAQDAGGAITGPARGDLFFGWGDEAGARAGRQNDPAARWTILAPRALARRLTS
ncbi:lytic murein transglycosylase [Alkalicaulis satelles]|uniref:peptidoglycan lytic exotransglycosylase n=1 Tax=Alkalicaulis satelles TaxID=2609175 RepID=A0A5M6ZLL0_9PROT|nr:lytic murein transglycosylase [Alkalicaulis satelles]